MKIVHIRNLQIGGDNAPIVLIAGPCVIENCSFTMDVAEKIKRITEELGIGFIFKSSYDKANRTSVKGFRGPGINEGLAILERVKKELGVPVITDIHTPDEAAKAAEYVDIIQIPAFLCRQTDLLLAAGNTGIPVNVKKGQFLAPWDMEHVAAKIASTGNEQIMLCERGVSFGYNQLVVDMRSLPIMRSLGYPVVFDATHSVQKPGGRGASSGGDRQYVASLAKAATSMKIDALFLEVHPSPDEAPSDGPNMWPIDDLSCLLKDIVALDRIVKKL